MADTTKHKKEIQYVFIYENQRRFPMVGWSEDSLLPTDRWKWSSEDGKTQLKKDTPSADLLPCPMCKFIPNREWEVVVDSNTDKDGWCYAFDFPASYHKHQCFTDWVRRRRWRKAYETSFDAGGLVSESSNAVDIESPSEQMAAHRQQEKKEKEKEQATSSSGGGKPSPQKHSDPTPSQSQKAETPSPPAKKAETHKSPTPKKVVPKTPPPPSPEEELIASWKEIRGSRSGAATLQISELRLPHGEDVYLRVAQGMHDFESQVYPHQQGDASRPVDFETYFLVADDTEPIRISLWSHVKIGSPTFHGEAVLSLRGRSCDDNVQRLVSAALTYTEAGTADLTLYPRVRDSDHSVRQKESMGIVRVNWSFDLRKVERSDFCHSCGRLPLLCACDDEEEQNETEKKAKTQRYFAQIAKQDASPEAQKQKDGGSAKSSPSKCVKHRSGHLAVRMLSGRFTSRPGFTSISPFLCLHYHEWEPSSGPFDWGGKPKRGRNEQPEHITLQTRHLSGFDATWSETFAAEVLCGTEGVHIFAMDHCTFGKNKVIGTTRRLRIDPDFTRKSSVEQLKLVEATKLDECGHPVPPSDEEYEKAPEVGRVTIVMEWTPYTVA